MDSLLQQWALKKSADHVSAKKAFDALKHNNRVWKNLWIMFQQKLSKSIQCIKTKREHVNTVEYLKRSLLLSCWNNERLFEMIAESQHSTHKPTHWNIWKGPRTQFTLFFCLLLPCAYMCLYAHMHFRSNYTSARIIEHTPTQTQHSKYLQTWIL